MTAFLRDGKRVLLCHRSAGPSLWYPDVWDLPGGHVEAGESPGIALVRELREELGISLPQPPGPPQREISAGTFDMQVWLAATWTGTPVNAAPDGHDDIGWFGEPELAALPLAHENYFRMFAEMLACRHG